MRLLPIQVLLQRPVAGFAIDTHAGHRGVVAVCGRVVILLEAGVVAPGTGRIPIHAPSRPMAVLARIAKVVAIDVKPLVRVRLVGRFLHLIPATGKRRQKLDERRIADDAFHAERLEVAFQTERDDLKFIPVGADGGGVGPVRDGSRRMEGHLIRGPPQGPFGQPVG